MSSTNPHRKHRWLRAFLITLGCVVVLAVGVPVFLTFWLTPQRLSEMVSRRASEYLQADVEVHNLRFTIWSSFPRFCIATDSCRVVSRSLDSLPEETKKSLPHGYRDLMHTGAFKASLNVPALLKGRIKLHDVEVEKGRLNLIALTDTTANWLIFPETADPKQKIPPVEADFIAFTEMEGVEYKSMETGLHLQVNPGKAEIRAAKGSGGGSKGGEGKYDCDFNGLLSASVPGLRLLRDFPFSLTGEVALRFNPFNISLSDFGIGLGKIKARTTLSLFGEENARIDKFSFKTDTFGLLTLFDYLPAEILPEASLLGHGITANVRAVLDSPYDFSTGTLPQLTVGVSLPEGEAEFNIGGRPVTVGHSTIAASLYFDGQHLDRTSFTLSPFSVSADGLEATVNGKIRNLTGSPQVETDLGFKADFRKLGNLFPGLAQLNALGYASGTAVASFRMPSLSAASMSDIKMAVAVASADFAIDTEKKRSRLQTHGLMLNANAEASAGAEGFRFLKPIAVSLATDAASWQRGNTALRSKGLGVKGNVALLESDTLFGGFRADVSLPWLKIDAAGHPMLFRGAAIDLSFREATAAEKKIVPAEAPGPVFADSLWLKRTPHLPAVLRVNSPGFANFVENWRMAADLTLDSARWDLPGYPHPFKLKGADLFYDFDSLSLRHFDLSSGQSRLDLSGMATGFRRLIAGDAWAPVFADLKVKGKTIDINQIAKATGSHYEPRANSGKNDADTLATPAWILPRNITANIRLGSAHTYYTNLDLERLDALIKLREGMLNIPSLALQTGFGSLGLKAVYDSSDLTDLKMDCSLDLEKVDLQTLYGKLTSMTRKFPQIKNLSGVMGIGGKVSFGIFPDMSVDMASLKARLGLAGTGLQLKQDAFVKHVARMLLIHNSHPIDIGDIAVSAVVHDNLLELYPFHLDFADYRLVLEGVNNFAGELDYHVGVFHSPVPFHFGINVEGMYHHPEIHFGGSGWNPDKARKITGSIEKSFTWNFVRKMQWAGKALMHKAASGQTL